MNEKKGKKKKKTKEKERKRMSFSPIYAAFTLMSSSTTVLMSNTDSMAALARSVIESNWRLVSACNVVVFIVLSIAQRLQRYFFGALSATERASVRGHLFDWLVFKVVLVVAALSADVGELLVWFGWFFPIGVLQAAAHLTKERVDLIASAAEARPARGTLARLLAANLLVIYATVGLVWLGWHLFSAADTSVLFLLFFEPFLLALHALRTTAAFLVHIYDSTVDGVWERRAAILYDLDLYYHIALLVLKLVHLVHLQYVHGLSCSLVDLFIMVHVRLVWVNLAKRVASHRNYVRLLRAIREQYKSLSGEQLVGRDDCCAICREKMLVALELPCTHLFHQSCLTTWLEEHSSCPNCRRHLLDVAADVEALRRARGYNQAQQQPQAPPPPAHQHGHGHAHAHGHAHGHHHHHPNPNPLEPAPQQEVDDELPSLEPFVVDPIEPPSIIVPAGVPREGEEEGANGNDGDDEHDDDNDDDDDDGNADDDDEDGDDDGDDGDDEQDDDEQAPSNFLEWFAQRMTGTLPVAANDVRQLHEMFPHFDQRVIERDLARTGSVEATIENILEGRIDLSIVNGGGAARADEGGDS
jgi:hypothetical protein